MGIIQVLYIINMSISDGLLVEHSRNMDAHRKLGRKILKHQKCLIRLRSQFADLGDVNVSNTKILDARYRDAAIKKSYVRRCVQWSHCHGHTPTTVYNNIIAECHRRFHDTLLHGYVFVMDGVCVCATWVYGCLVCTCGKTSIMYDKESICYDYGGDITLDDISPMYMITAKH